MTILSQTPTTPLLYSIPSLSEATQVGQSSIWDAIKAEELHTVRLVIAGSQRKRTLIRASEAQRWVDTFPARENAA
jgi:hypothetical protein